VNDLRKNVEVLACYYGYGMLMGLISFAVFIIVGYLIFRDFEPRAIEYCRELAAQNLTCYFE